MTLENNQLRTTFVGKDLTDIPSVAQNLTASRRAGTILEGARVETLLGDKFPLTQIAEIPDIYHGNPF